MEEIIIRIPVKIELALTVESSEPGIQATAAVPPAVEPKEKPRRPVARIPVNRQRSNRGGQVCIDGGKPMSQKEAASQLGIGASAISFAVRKGTRCQGHAITRFQPEGGSSPDMEGE